MDLISISERSSAPWVTIVGDRTRTDDTTGEVIPLLAHDLRAMAATVLRGNENGGYTVPSRLTYPHQWNWDSALAALGWAELDPARAWTELETLAGARDSQGMIPHIAFHTRVPDRVNGRLRGLLTTVALPYARYLPGPRWWGKRCSVDGRRISGITQPPLAASCMRLLFEAHPDERRARDLLRPLLDWHRFLLEERDPRGVGEPVLIHPWESGRDNSVEWDVPLWRVMPEVSVLHRRDTHSVDAAEASPAAMSHHVLHVHGADRRPLVHDLASGVGRSLLFTRTKHSAKRLAKQLTDAGIPAVDLHGDLTQKARERNLAAFATGRVRVLTATDIAAHGIHVDDVDLVVHVDPPTNHKAYLHRSGRTARAGSSGAVVTLATPEQRREVAGLIRQAKVRATEMRVRPGGPEVRALVGEPAPVVPPAPASAGRSSGSAPRCGPAPGWRAPRRPARGPS